MFVVCAKTVTVVVVAMCVSSDIYQLQRASGSHSELLAGWLKVSHLCKHFHQNKQSQSGAVTQFKEFKNRTTWQTCTQPEGTRIAARLHSVPEVQGQRIDTLTAIQTRYRWARSCHAFTNGVAELYAHIASCTCYVPKDGAAAPPCVTMGLRATSSARPTGPSC